MTTRSDDASPGEILLTVAVHRWFRNGAAWAYHPEFPDPQDSLIDATTPLLLAREDQVKRTMPYRGGTLVCLKQPDPDCEDAKAANRRPSLLVCCHLPDAVRKQFDNDGHVFSAIINAIRELPLPTAPGMTPTALISVRPPVLEKKGQPEAVAANSGPDDYSGLESPEEQFLRLKEELYALQQRGFRARPRGPLELCCMLIWRLGIGFVRLVDLLLMLPFRFLLPAKQDARSGRGMQSGTVWPPPPTAEEVPQDTEEPPSTDRWKPHSAASDESPRAPYRHGN